MRPTGEKLSVRAKTKPLFCNGLACGNMRRVTAALGIVHATRFFSVWRVGRFVVAHLFDNLFVTSPFSGGEHAVQLEDF